MNSIVRDILEIHGIHVTYLNPRITPALGRRSKIGGYEQFLLEDIDQCPTCHSRMTAIIEIFEEEYPECYFPSGKDYLLVKTCYSPKCEFQDDILFHLGYGNSKDLSTSRALAEVVLPEAYFEHRQSKEIPLISPDGSNLESLIALYGREEFEEMMYEYYGMIGTKLNGDPFSFHELEIPICACGKKKHHFLQISSYEPNLHLADNRPSWEWEPSLGVFIGEVGNYHFYVCLICGEKTIERKWDCV